MNLSIPQNLASELVRLRRKFHQHPETGYKEFRTTARICEYLDGLDCRLICGPQLRDAMTDPEALDRELIPEAYADCKIKYPDDQWIEKIDGVPGAVAVFKGARPGPVFGLRFDIDGLPIAESASDAHLPAREGFAADNGNMHACGHDGHLTMGLGLASALSENIDLLSGTYYLMFQPAEEVILGGKVFSKLNFIKDLDFFFATHIGMSGPGMVTAGVAFFADRRYRVTYHGKSAHAGGAPQAGKNALVAACTAVNSLYGIPRHSGGDSRINVGDFAAPNVANIIPDHVSFDLDLRSQTAPVMDYLTAQAENIVNGAAAMQDVSCEMAFVKEAVVAENTDAMVKAVRKACLDMGMAPSQVLDRLQISGSEDATYIMNEVTANGGQTTFIGLGAPSAGTHHNGNFDFNEADLEKGVRLLLQLTSNLSREAG